MAALIDNAAIAEFAKEAGKKALSVLQAHFTFSAHEITKAYQDSLAKSLDAINNSQKKSWFASKLNQEFSEQFAAQIISSGIETKALIPFIKTKTKLFQIDSINDTDLASFINAQSTAELADFLLEQMQQVAPLDNSLIKALRNNDLLAKVMLFFLREQFRTDSRFEKTLMALQQEALLFNQQRMLIIMQELQISSRVKASDEFTQHNTKTQKIIQKSVLNLHDFATDLPNYTKFSLMLGSAVSSTGNLEQSELLFSEIIANNSATKEEKARAYFNRFQVRLRGKNYQNALADLKAAIKINPEPYALHDVHTYPMLQLLGVGGMGCVFLCENDNPLIDHKNVVVKCFWETLKGSGKKVFKEAIAMRQIAGDYVPEPLDAGYANRYEQKNAFFVTEYIEGTIDGEAWLKKYGPMDLETGLAVALTVAKALQLAHDKEILHLDLKPANILLTDSSSAIIDFGLAQIAPSLQQEALTRQNQSGLTQFGQAVMGTLHYAPPEQQGYFEYGVPTVRSDLFSFGATLYRFWTGLSPRLFSDRKLPNVSELRELIFDCVEEDPKNRPASAALVVEQLEQILKPTPIPTSPTPIPTSPTSIPTSPTSISKDFEVFRDNLKDGNKGPEMVWIPAGSFQMGSEEYDNEKPVHEVSLDRFAVGKYQVTFAEYDEFAQATGKDKPDDEGWGRDKHPVINVSWHDAVAYAKWLSEQTGYIYRLPTEAEWEYAARAGTTTKYCFGDDESNLGDYAWYGDNSSGKTHPVGEKKPNSWGLYDVHGNVWEWVSDIYSSDYYSSSLRSNPKGPGGAKPARFAWYAGYNGAQFAPAANRDIYTPDGRYYDLGFRLVRQP